MELEQRPDLLAHLGLSPSDFRRVCALPFSEGEDALDALKAKARKNLKVRAKELHPDINGGDETKTALFKLLNQVVQEIEKLNVVRVPDVEWPPPNIRVDEYEPLDANANGDFMGRVYVIMYRVTVIHYRR